MMKHYRSDCRLFLEALAADGVSAEVEAVDKRVLRQYVVWLRNRGLKPSSVARRIHSVRSFWNYLWESEYTDANPFRKLTLPNRSLTLAPTRP
jgi:site-specific recombinase XerD